MAKGTVSFTAFTVTFSAVLSLRRRKNISNAFITIFNSFRLLLLEDLKFSLGFFGFFLRQKTQADLPKPGQIFHWDCPLYISFCPVGKAEDHWEDNSKHFLGAKEKGKSNPERFGGSARVTAKSVVCSRVGSLLGISTIGWKPPFNGI